MRRNTVHAAGRLLIALTICAASVSCISQSREGRPPASPAARQAQPAPQPPLGQGVQGTSLIVEPDDGKLKLTRPIRAAHRSIDLEIYMLTDRTLIHDLEYAAANGVRVRVILERTPYGSDVSSAAINHSAYDQLYAADIPVRWSSARYALTHQKTMVIDGTVGYILTLNFTKSAFKANREFGIVDRSPSDVQEVSAVFDADWNDRPYLPSDSNVLLSPVNSRSRLLALLGRAHREVEVYAEEVQDTEFEARLRSLAAAGIRVQMITSSNPGSAADIVRLRKSGVQLREIASPYIHAKMVLVDQRWAFVGSENISAASLDRNRELGLLIADLPTLARLHSVFEQDWRQ